MTDGCKKGKKINSSKRDIKCFNCHKRGHFAHDFHGPSGAKEGQHPSKGKLSKGADSTVNTAAPIQDSAWSAVALRSLATDEGTYLNETPITIEPPHPAMSANATPLMTLTGAVTSELYNSGATQHMTPHKDAQVNYEVIAPKPINAANQQTFRAIRWGDLPICIPNGPGSTHITLTLVSIGLIDEAGYTMSFTSGT